MIPERDWIAACAIASSQISKGADGEEVFEAFAYGIARVVEMMNLLRTGTTTIRNPDTGEDAFHIGVRNTGEGPAVVLWPAGD